MYPAAYTERTREHLLMRLAMPSIITVRTFHPERAEYEAISNSAGCNHAVMHPESDDRAAGKGRGGLGHRCRGCG